MCLYHQICVIEVIKKCEVFLQFQPSVNKVQLHQFHHAKLDMTWTVTTLAVNTIADRMDSYSETEICKCAPSWMAGAQVLTIETYHQSILQNYYYPFTKHLEDDILWHKWDTWQAAHHICSDRQRTIQGRQEQCSNGFTVNCELEACKSLWL
jgi:hypothetical protein